MTSENLKEAALQYAKRGWVVIPLHTPEGKICSCGKLCCKSAGKHPRTAHGLKDASKDPATIQGWWDQWPNANIGIVTGAESGLVVLDMDPRHDGENSLEQLIAQKGTLPETLETLTGGGGRHYYFRHPGKESKIRNAAGLLGLSGLDLRGDGGYIVAPPSLHASSKRYEWELSSNLDQIAETPDWLLAGEVVSPAVVKTISGGIPEGGRNNYLTSLAGTMRNKGMDQESILSALRVENRTKCKPPLTESEVGTIAGSISKYPANQTENLTDIGNSKRLVSLYGHKIRFVSLWGKWLVYDGKRWVKDSTGLIQALAKKTVISIYREASQETDEEKRKALGRHAKQSESAGSIRNMIYLAQSEPGISINPLELDSDDFLFNCLNGTIDLRTGEMLPHNPGDLISKLSPVDFDPDAKSQLFDDFLLQVTGGNQELLLFLQVMAGYCLTGNTGEEKLFFLYGPGATGKSTFMEALKAVWGDYGATADFETFLKKPSGGGPRNDIARLAGVRFIASIEVEEGKQLAEALIKSLTGGDTITSRFLFQEAFEFKPKGKLILAANHKPKLKNDDDAIWRRILQIPFDQIIPEEKRDPTIKARLKDLKESGPAILAWAVKGCLEWLERGLWIPDVIKESTNTYREENDPLKDFLEEKCTYAPDLWISSRDLFTEYAIWAKDNGIRHPLEQRAFGNQLKARGLKSARRNSGRKRGWEGIGFYSQSDTVTDGDAHFHKPEGDQMSGSG